MSKATKAARRRKPTPPASPNNVLRVPKKDGEGENLATARVIMDPDFRHGMAVAQVLKAQFGNQDSSPGIGDYADALKEKANAAAEGDLAFASRMLAAQAITLDSIFGEMARRMALNMGEYLGATETYGRIAMKAQAQSRATLEALAKLHQPREQTGRHVHVNEGGQAIIADQFHNHAGGGGRKMDFQAKNPMQPERLASAPRCLARTRSRTACQSPAVKGRKRCRMHGGTNPGAPKGNRNS